MGLIRYLLALTILLWHSGTVAGYKFLDTKVSIHAFFITSGFYMCLILHEKYVKENGSYWLYLTNRLLRIYPAYWLILLLTFFVTSFQAGSIRGTSVGAVIRNVTIFLSPEYFTLQDTHLIFLVPVAWTLGLELLFYAIAPFVMRLRPLTLSLMILASLVLRKLLFYPRFLSHEYIPNRYILTELGFFLMGGIAYYLYKYIRQKKISRSALLSMYALIIIFILLWAYIVQITGRQNITEWIFYAMFIAAIPCISIVSRGSVADKLLGDMSYPLYLINLPVILMIRGSNKPMLDDPQNLLIILVSSLLSYLLVVLVDRPINSYRQRRLIHAARSHK